jgi:hypothetical protein
VRLCGLGQNAIAVLLSTSHAAQFFVPPKRMVKNSNDARTHHSDADQCRRTLENDKQPLHLMEYRTKCATRRRDAPRPDASRCLRIRLYVDENFP